MFGVPPQNPYPQQGPWAGLPVAAQPWSGGPGWNAAQQAPWRLSPWTTQGMPTGQAPQMPQMPALPGGGLLDAGMSSGLENFNPLIPGGGFYPGLLGGGQQQQQQQAPALAPTGWQAGGQMFATRPAAQQALQQMSYDDAESPGMGFRGRVSPVGGWQQHFTNRRLERQAQPLTGAQAFQQMFGAQPPGMGY